MSIANKSVLLLNADQKTILSIVSVKRAIGMYFRGAINIILHDGDVLHHSLNFGTPSIICLREWKYIPYRNMQLTRKKILMRDNWTCQYCNKKLTRTSATIDHIIPKSYKNKNNFKHNTWKNIVACCKKCNTRKGNLLLNQINMSLIRDPFTPNFCHLIDDKYKKIEWLKYIGLNG